MANNNDFKQVNALKQAEFDQLSNDQKIQRGLEITRSLIDSENKVDLEIEEISDDLQSFTLLNVEVSPFPTKSRRIMRFTLTEQLEKFIKSMYFINVDDYSVIFSNIEDLSYHNFENILNLDHLFNDVEFALKKKKTLSSKVKKYTLEGSTESLLSLDKLNYYTVPLNNTQRGGKRLIFHSNQLSYSLTQMIEKSHFFDKKNFSHVNNVFRLNKFAPGDKKFKSHYDTPYADHRNGLYSKYTMIVYLTGNQIMDKDCPPLKFKDIVVNKIKENDCIIFDQSLEHEGNAYADENKIFIRTELIYRIENMEYNEEVANLFNIACYMTKEPQMQQYSANLFNNCVKIRYREDTDDIERAYLFKKNLDVIYVTDGNQYWFPKHIDLKSTALLIVLDYFNGKIYNVKNIKIQSKPLLLKDINSKTSEQIDEEIFYFISISSFSDEKIDDSKFNQFREFNDFVPDDLLSNYTVYRCECGIGHNDSIKAEKYFEIEKSNTERKLKEILSENSVLIFDNMIKINYSKIKIQRDCEQEHNLASGKIHLSDFFLNTENQINFAACQCSDLYDEEDVVLFERKKLHTFQLPNIGFQVLKDGIKLSIDIFNNGFIHQATDNFQQPYTNEDETEYITSKKRKHNYYEQNENDKSSEEEISSSSNSEDESEEEDLSQSSNERQVLNMELKSSNNLQKDHSEERFCKENVIDDENKNHKNYVNEESGSKAKIALQPKNKIGESFVQKMDKMNLNNKKKAEEEDEDYPSQIKQARLITESQ